MPDRAIITRAIGCTANILALAITVGAATAGWAAEGALPGPTMSGATVHATGNILPEGRTWRVVELPVGQVLRGREPSITFAKGQVYGGGGCNSFTGSYKLLGDRLSFPFIEQTVVACAGRYGRAVMAQENALIDALTASFTVERTGEVLLLHRDGGGLLRLKPERRR